MTSLAAAEAPLEGVRGLAFFGFPLHAAGGPSTERGAHLVDVGVPMLFLQGSAISSPISPCCGRSAPGSVSARACTSCPRPITRSTS